MTDMAKAYMNTNANANVNVNAMQCDAMLCYVCQHSLSSFFSPLSLSPWQATLFVRTLPAILLEIGGMK